MEEYTIPSKPIVPNENDNLGLLVNKVKEVNTYTDAVRTKLINTDNSLVDLLGDNTVSKLPIGATLTDAVEKVGEVGTKVAASLNTVKATADSALSKATANESSILSLQNELGVNKTTLENNINAIREVL